MTWIDDSRVQVTWLNRAQNTSVYALYDINGTGNIDSYHEHIVYNGWLELVSVLLGVRPYDEMCFDCEFCYPKQQVAIHNRNL